MRSALPIGEVSTMGVKKNSLTQQIAVFGESGSGKTVMISSFYGSAQEPSFLSSSFFNVIAEQTAQGKQLQQNFLLMRDESRVPAQNRFGATSYEFEIRLKKQFANDASRAPFDALRLIWHDYPGEWFEQDVDGEEEAKRRIEAFRSLLGSDVALILVDGQKLRDQAGHEERYLKSLLGNLRTGLLRVQSEVLTDDAPLTNFPRIWMFGLSKADLLPDFDVFSFRDLLIKKVSGEITELEKVLKSFVVSPDAMSVGEDFVLLSSARFEPDRIEVTERIGIDLILPIAAMLPFERHLQWLKRKQISTRVSDGLLAGVGAITTALLAEPSRKEKAKELVARVTTGAVVEGLLSLTADKVLQIRKNAESRHDYLAAVLSGFELDLENAETSRVLHRQP